MPPETGEDKSLIGQRLVHFRVNGERLIDILLCLFILSHLVICIPFQEPGPRMERICGCHPVECFEAIKVISGGA
jgi:hypothetical protein